MRRESDFNLHVDVECDDLNENGPHEFLSLNAQPTVGGSIWEGFRVMAFLGRSVSLDVVFEVSKALANQDVSSQLLFQHHACMPVYLHACMPACLLPSSQP